MTSPTKPLDKITYISPVSAWSYVVTLSGDIRADPSYIERKLLVIHSQLLHFERSEQNSGGRPAGTHLRAVWTL